MSTPGMGQVLPFRRRSAPTRMRPASADPVVVRIRVTLDGAQPAIWRELDVRGALSLDALHQVLNRAMGWHDCHLHRFSTDAAHPYETYFLTDFDVAEGTPGVEESAVRIDQVLGMVGDELTYLYDFGDGWQHTVTVLSVRPAGTDDPTATCLDGALACPLEDCGGIGGHLEILDAFRTDADRQSWPEILRDWVPADYDPEEFSLERANLMLTLIGASAPEIFEAISGSAKHAERASALDDVLARLDPPEVAIELAELAARAREPENAGDSDAAAAVQPWQHLLDRAADDGIPLTSAGWMKPDVVIDLATRTELVGKWFGPCNREQNTQPLASLRTYTQAAGLLRKYKDRLLLTRTGRSALTSPDRLGRAVAGGFLAAKRPLPQRHATVFFLLAVSAGLSGDLAVEFTGRWMLELRWMTTAAGHDVPLDDDDISLLVDDARDMLNWADGDPMSLRDRVFGPNARHLARLALWPH